MVIVLILRRILALVVSIILLPVWIVTMIVDAIIGAAHTRTAFGRLWG